jgi:hypothetical protein
VVRRCPLTRAERRSSAYAQNDTTHSDVQAPRTLVEMACYRRTVEWIWRKAEQLNQLSGGWPMFAMLVGDNRIKSSVALARFAAGLADRCCGRKRKRKVLYDNFA